MGNSERGVGRLTPRITKREEMKKLALLLFLLVPFLLAPTSVTWNGTVRSIPNAGERNWADLTDYLVDLANNAQTTNFQKIGVRVADSSPVTVSSSTDYLVITDLTVAGAVTVNLPAGDTGQTFAIVDGKGDAGTNAITIDGDSAETINGSATFTIGVDNGGIQLAWSGTEWKVLSEFINTVGGPIPRSSIAAGTADYVVINDGSGNLSEEAQLAVSRGGTGSGTALNNDRIMISSAGNIVENTALTGSRAMVTAASGLPSFSTVTAAELAFMSGVTSNVQTQLDSKLENVVEDTTPQLGGALDAQSNNITALGSTVYDGTGALTISGSTIELTAGATDLALNTFGGGRVALNSTLIPDTDGTLDLGLPASRWGDLELQNTLGLHGATSGEISLQAAATTTSYTVTWPAAQGGSGEVLENDGSGNLSWVPSAGGFTDPTTTRGDIIFRNASTVIDRLPVGADNRVLRSDGTDLSYGQVDDPDMFTTGAAASSSDIGIVTTGAQTLAGAKTFQNDLSVVPTSGNSTLFLTPPADTDRARIDMGTAGDENNGGFIYQQDNSMLDVRVGDERVAAFEAPGRFEVYHDDGNAALRIKTEGTDPNDISRIDFGDTASNTVGQIEYDHSTNAMMFYTNGTEYARIRSTGEFQLQVREDGNCGTGTLCSNDGDDDGTGETCEGGNCQTVCVVEDINWGRNGVHVSFGFTVLMDPTTTVATECRFDPFGGITAFTAMTQVKGSCRRTALNSDAQGVLFADDTNDDIQIRINVVDHTNQSRYYCHGTMTGTF